MEWLFSRKMQPKKKGSTRWDRKNNVQIFDKVQHALSVNKQGKRRKKAFSIKCYSNSRKDPKRKSDERKEQNRKKAKYFLAKQSFLRKITFGSYAANSISKSFLIGEWESVKKRQCRIIASSMQVLCRKFMIF